MKLSIKLIIWFLVPISVFAQSTVTLKKQADKVAKALAGGDYATVIDHMYPKAVKMAGGKKALLQKLSAGITQMKAQGVSIENAIIGEPGKFYKAGTEIHCLVPENIRIKTANGSFATQSNLLAISQDGGKNWMFIDLNKDTLAKIPQLFPNFNKDLKLREPKMPGM